MTIYDDDDDDDDNNHDNLNKRVILNNPNNKKWEYSRKQTHTHKQKSRKSILAHLILVVDVISLAYMPRSGCAAQFQNNPVQLNKRSKKIFFFFYKLLLFCCCFNKQNYMPA